MSQTVEQFLMQFHFKSTSDCHSSIVNNRVLIAKHIQIRDIDKPASEFFQVGQRLFLGDASYIVREEHLPQKMNGQ